MPLNVVGGNGFGKNTVAFGTVINQVLPPRMGAITRLDKLAYLDGGTAHTITALRPLGPNYNPTLSNYGGSQGQAAATQYPGGVQCTAIGAAGQAVINLNYLPGSAAHQLQANDLVLIQETDGVVRVYTVSSVATLAITLTGNLSVGVGVGSWVWDLGVLATTNPIDGKAHPTFLTTASTQLLIPSDALDNSGIVAPFYTFQPMLLQSNNITATGQFQYGAYSFTAPTVSGPGPNW